MSSTRIVPVVNRTDGVTRRRDRNRGNPTRAPARRPDRDADQLPSARAKPSSPVLKASFEHCPHHGTTCGLAVFQARRNAGRDQPSAGVSCSPSRP
ncbi:hypothetical protein ACFQY4_22595 [Catellatospora bangladeshensis]|uniref:hypothetical protein n=1 Tax=Catellatospora bangladeshensis TaxID=310355 RepID=UPI00361103D1